MTTTPLFTANNVDLYVNGQQYAFCENVSISRSVNRSPRFAVGDPRYKDAPVTTASVSVQLTGMVPIATLNGQTTLQNSTNNAVHNSLLSEVAAKPFGVSFHETTDSNGTPLYAVDDCQYNNDAVSVASGDIVTYNVTLIAPDTSVWRI